MSSTFCARKFASEGVDMGNPRSGGSLDMEKTPIGGENSTSGTTTRSMKRGKTNLEREGVQECTSV